MKAPKITLAEKIAQRNAEAERKKQAALEKIAVGSTLYTSAADSERQLDCD